MLCAMLAWLPRNAGASLAAGGAEAETETETEAEVEARTLATGEFGDVAVGRLEPAPHLSSATNEREQNSQSQR